MILFRAVRFNEKIRKEIYDSTKRGKIRYI